MNVGHCDDCAPDFGCWEDKEPCRKVPADRVCHCGPERGLDKVWAIGIGPGAGHLRCLVCLRLVRPMTEEEWSNF
jgi:hypothetical protein